MGDIVACGTAHGGCAALMGLALDKLGSDRTLWIFDAVNGLPAPTLDDPDFEMAEKFTGECRGGIEDVTQLLEGR